MEPQTILRMFPELNSLLEAPCREVKSVEPFPFKSNRISRGVRFQHFLILFPFYPEYKKLQHLYTFNLYTRKWGSVELRNSPEILENTDNYKVIPEDENGFILFGCYKAFQANTTGNLFFQSQTMTLKKTLGRISAKIDEGDLILEWEDLEEAKQFPYLDKFSMHTSFTKDKKEYLTIFGGCDENGKVTNDLYDFDFEKKKVRKMEFVSTHLGRNETLPDTRMSHGCTRTGSLLIFGGEDENSDMINDLWHLPFISRIRHLDRQAQCCKFNKKTINRCPKLGTPCSWYETSKKDFLLYIAKSTTQSLPPFRNYLCAETQSNYESTTLSQKDPLPFDGVPHTMEIFENQLIFGFESSIYSITFENKIAQPSGFESYGDFDEGVLTKKKTHPMNFKGHMRQYFEEKPFPDVRFKVQGEEISAHRGILSVRCPFFAELFWTEGKKDEPVEITDLTPIAFSALLEWLYCNEILDLKDAVAIELLKVTNKYLLPKLKTEAEKCSMKNLTTENILERAKLAVELSARELETAVVRFIAKEMDEGKKKEELKNFPDSIQERVCNMEKINDESFAAKLNKINTK